MKLNIEYSSEDDGEPFAEVDPSGRFGRYDELLGVGAVKRVYRAFDQLEGIDVAWNQVCLSNFSGDPSVHKRLVAEIVLLKNLKHDNIVSLHGPCWKQDGSLNFITELCTSGSLRSYRKKHRRVSIRAMKKWSMQILKGLNYLHSRGTCIIHRDINCSNVFINGNTGEVKIGDLGLAAAVGRSHTAHSLLGTPEYMAPELYDEDYNEMVDIYSFGMCVLEMATGEMPYLECQNVAQIYRKVTGGVMPEALKKVKDPEVKAFIENCIGRPRNRPSASDLIKDPFFTDLHGYGKQNT